MSVSCECCVCYQVEVSATCRSLVQRNLSECGGSECDLETSTRRRSRPTRAVEPRKKKWINDRGILVRISAGRRVIPLPQKRPAQLYDVTRHSFNWCCLCGHFREDKISCTCRKLNQDYSLEQPIRSSAYPVSHFRISLDRKHQSNKLFH
jgi:hypothetical protein